MSVTTTAHQPQLEHKPASSRLRMADIMAISAIAVCLLLQLAILPVGLDPQDEGYFAEQAVRVLQGQVPYRDFDSLYTPGLLYLHAGLFAAIGEPHILALRALSWVARAALAFGLYALARQLARPLWAGLPALYLLVGLDRAPVHWEPHPGWLSMVGTVAAIWLMARLPSLPPARRSVGLAVVGVLVGLVFLFKQNAGVFLGLAVGGVLLLRGLQLEPRPVTPFVRAVQLLTLVLVLGLLGWLIHPHPQANVLLYVYLLAPVAGAGAMLALAVPVSRNGEGLGSRAGTLSLVGIGFAAVTLPWLAILIRALNGDVHYLSGFVGGVEQGPLALPPELPEHYGWAAVVGIGIASIAAVHAGGSTRLVILALGGLLAVAAVLLTREANESLRTSIFLTLGRAPSGMQAIVPIAALWAGIWLARQSALPADAWRLRWYVAAGAFTFLTQYPRMDNFHLIWSACIPLVVGAIALDRLHSYLAARWKLTALHRRGLAAALLLVPALTALPTLYWRGEMFVKRDPATHRAGLVPFSPVSDLPSIHGLIIPRVDGERLLGLRDHLQRTTAPGEPILVYPTAPLLYLVADRPNPTRYSHLYPGAAPPSELIRIMTTLETTPVRTVIVSDAGLLIWELPAENAPLEEHLSRRYREIARFGEYRVFRLRESG